MADPVSWLVVERGWKVLDATGRDVGRVEEVIGDSGNDIFNGLAISTGLLKGRRYVPSEQVAEIVEGAVRLDLDQAEVERLGEHHEPPPSAEIRPD
jgi:PRC-barrel domain protein